MSGSISSESQKPDQESMKTYGPQLPHATVHQISSSHNTAPTKMPISELMEVSVRLGLNVAFDCVSESGPPHQRFVFQCVHCYSFTSN